MMEYLKGAKTDDQLSSVSEELNSAGERIRLAVSNVPESGSVQPDTTDAEEPKQVILKAAGPARPPTGLFTALAGYRGRVAASLKGRGRL